MPLVSQVATAAGRQRSRHKRKVVQTVVLAPLVMLAVWRNLHAIRRPRSSLTPDVARLVRIARRKSVVVHVNDMHVPAALHHFFMPLSKGACQAISTAESLRTKGPGQPIMLSIRVVCQDLFRQSPGGTGNWIFFMYSLRLAALAHGNVDVLFQCTDSSEQQLVDLYFPWMAGWFPAPRQGDLQPAVTGERRDRLPDSLLEYNAVSCSDKYPVVPILPLLAHDIRRMAIGLVGVPNQQHPSAEYAARHLHSPPLIRQQALSIYYDAPSSPIKPLLDNFELDDAILHFRCGDLVNKPDEGYMFYRYSSFARHISSAARRIGIATQPFEEPEKKGGFWSLLNFAKRSKSADYHRTHRKNDAKGNTGERCRKLVTGLVDYLTPRFPLATISVYNGLEETVPLSMARMVMANQTIAACSTFSAFPALATFGHSYIPYPTVGFLQWMNKENAFPNATDQYEIFVEKDRLQALALVEFWQPETEASILEWFRNDEFELLLQEETLCNIRKDLAFCSR